MPIITPPNPASQAEYSEGPQKDIESEHHNKSQHYIIREKEAINLLHPFQGRCRVVTRRHLIGRHTSKIEFVQRVRSPVRSRYSFDSCPAPTPAAVSC